jgi:predicted Rossmann-fold nucleotide-binding protein
VLVGADYWRGLTDWVRSTLVTSGAIAPGDIDLCRVTDSVEEAASILTEYSRRRHALAEAALGEDPGEPIGR